MANAAAPSNATGAKKRTERIEAVAGECLRAVAEDGDAEAGGAPSEAALLAALEAAPDVLALLCATLAHDFVCLGYDFPPACAAFQARVDELPGDAPDAVVLFQGEPAGPPLVDVKPAKKKKRGA